MTVEQAQGWGWAEAIHPDDREKLVEEWQSCLTSGTPVDTEARIQRFDSSYRWFLIRANPLRDESGNIVKWYGTCTDIDDRKNAEAQLEEAYAQLTEAQRLSQTGSFTWDLQADEHTWSSEIYRIFGFEPGIKVTMQMIQSVIYPEDIPAVEATIGGAAQKADFELPFRIVWPGGELRHVQAVGHRVERIADRPVFVGAIQDLTENRMAAEALNKARSELAHMARVTTLSALTASISHEINQPISAVTTSAGACLRWLNRDQPDVQRAREAVMRIEDDGRRAAEIISHLKSFYKKDLSPQREMVSVNELVDEMLMLLRSEADRHSVVMRTELGADLPSVRADRVQLQQVLMNLMLNGMEAMSDGGGELKISTRCDAGKVMLCVSDTGMGIPADKMKEIFNAFVTTKATGTGMGLAISRTIIESHGGELWTTANPEGGAKFTFALPTTN
jgi:PAS domain S-box-containing protein